MLFLNPNFALAESKLTIPRFAIIKSSEANVRKGPGGQYPIEWIYQLKNIPVEIINEYEQWREIKDMNGEGGWIHSSILSGKRTVIVSGKEAKYLYKNHSKNSKLIAKIMPGYVCGLKNCSIDWCKVKCASESGWIPKSDIWGVYPHEEF